MKKTREFRPSRINFLDLCLILLFLFCLLGGLWRRYTLRAAEREAETEFLMLAELADVHPALADCLSVGEDLYLASGEYYGRITGIEVLPAKTWLLSDGVYREAVLDPSKHCRLVLEIGFSGSTSRGVALYEGRISVPLGSYLTLYSERAELAAQVQQITQRPLS